MDFFEKIFAFLSNKIPVSKFEIFTSLKEIELFEKIID